MSKKFIHTSGLVYVVAYLGGAYTSIQEYKDKSIPNCNPEVVTKVTKLFNEGLKCVLAENEYSTYTSLHPTVILDRYDTKLLFGIYTAPLTHVEHVAILAENLAHLDRIKTAFIKDDYIFKFIMTFLNTASSTLPKVEDNFIQCKVLSDLTSTLLEYYAFELDLQGIAKRIINDDGYFEFVGL